MKDGPLNVLTNEEGVAFIDWIPGMQKCGLLITL
jgi:hypothetical protein